MNKTILNSVIDIYIWEESRWSILSIWSDSTLFTLDFNRMIQFQCIEIQINMFVYIRSLTYKHTHTHTHIHFSGEKGAKGEKESARATLTFPIRHFQLNCHIHQLLFLIPSSFSIIIFLWRYDLQCVIKSKFYCRIKHTKMTYCHTMYVWVISYFLTWPSTLSFFLIFHVCVPVSVIIIFFFLWKWGWCFNQ